MGTMDAIVEVATFLPQYLKYRHIAKHTVRLAYCVDKVRQFYSSWMDLRQWQFDRSS